MVGLLKFALLLLLQENCWAGLTKTQLTEKDNQAVKSGIIKRSIDAFARRSAVDKNFIRFGRSGDYFNQAPDRSREKNLMSFSRVSRAAHDNFMRFGRPDEDIEAMETSGPASRRAENFMRFGRNKDNFMRFGRNKDNFMRFGRKDNFMRFGRNFVRPGRGKDNFMRFGRGDEMLRFVRAKDNFMRFGRKDNFMRFGRNYHNDYEGNLIEAEEKDLVPRKSEEKNLFERFGKSPKNDAGFIRFGRASGETEDEDDQRVDEDGTEGDLNLKGDKPKNGPIIRIKRDTESDPTTLWNLENLNRSGRDPEVEEDIPPQNQTTETRQLPATSEKSLMKRMVYPDILLEPEELSELSKIESSEYSKEDRPQMYILAA